MTQIKTPLPKEIPGSVFLGESTLSTEGRKINEILAFLTELAAVVEELNKPIEITSESSFPVHIHADKKLAVVEGKQDRALNGTTVQTASTPGSYTPTLKERLLGEVGKLIAIHEQLANDWTGIRVGGTTQTFINPHIEKKEAFLEVEAIINRLL